jgi:hypothetical protein
MYFFHFEITLLVSTRGLFVKIDLLLFDYFRLLKAKAFGLLLERMHFPHLAELVAAGLDFLGLEPRLNDIKWIGDNAGNATGYPGTNEVPEVRICLVPGL